MGLLLIGGCGRYDFEEKPIEEKAPRVSYPTVIHAVVGKTELAVMPEVTGKDLSFRVSPALPAGLTLDEFTGELRGVATTSADRADFVVTATNELGSATALLYLTALTGEVVDVLADGADDTDGMDATCRSSAVSGCSLRAAFDTANHLPGDKQLVLVPAGTYKLSRAMSGLKKKIVIAGAGPGKTVIEAANAGDGTFFFSVDNPLSLRLENVTIRGFSGTEGGAIRVSKGSLEVFGVAFEQNQSPRGAAIHALEGGLVTIDASTFAENEATGTPAWGGAINASGANTSVTVRRSTATRNRAKWGSFSHVELAATLTLENSTIYDNHATEAGALASPSGRYTVRDSTIAGNTVSSPTSAGIYLDAAAASFTLTNNLIVDNSIVGGAAADCYRKEAAGEVKSFGGNALGDASNCAALFSPKDLLGATGKLDPAGLADHGGLTKTVAILPGSAAIDLGNGCTKEDQRGAPRGEPCDAGAFELP